jgi:hypothetical protein
MSLHAGSADGLDARFPYRGLEQDYLTDALIWLNYGDLVSA